MKSQVPDVQKVRSVEATDEEAVVTVITLAFSCDPMVRWAYPEPREYLRNMPDLVQAFAGKAFACGGAYCLDDCRGAALWYPPGVEPDEQSLVELLQRTLVADKRADVFSVLEQMDSHHPPESHWYLPMIGVDPACQNNGYGGLLLRHVLKECDRERIPAYLEASNLRNMAHYERHGFEPIRPNPVREHTADYPDATEATLISPTISGAMLGHGSTPKLNVVGFRRL